MYKFVNIRSWSFNPPYRLTGGSATVAKDRADSRGKADALGNVRSRAGRGSIVMYGCM